MALQYDNPSSNPLAFSRQISAPLDMSQFNQQQQESYDYQPPAPYKPNKLMLLGATLKDLGATFQGRDGNSLQSLVSEQNRSLQEYNQSMMSRALERSKMQREDKRYDAEVMRENQKALDVAKMKAYEAGVPQEKLLGAVSLDEIGAALSEVKQAENNGIEMIIKQQQLANARAQAAKLQQEIEQGDALGPLEIEEKKLKLRELSASIKALENQPTGSPAGYQLDQFTRETPGGKQTWKREEPAQMSTGQQLAKEKRTEQVITLMEESEAKRQIIAKAQDSSKRLTPGLLGK
jgi:hypothetical protein